MERKVYYEPVSSSIQSFAICGRKVIVDRSALSGYLLVANLSSENVAFLNAMMENELLRKAVMDYIDPW